MKKQKRGLSKFLALVMTVSLLSPPGMPVLASASGGIPEGMKSTTAVSEMQKKASGSEAVRDEELLKETEVSGDHETVGAEDSKEQGDKKEETVEDSKREEEKKATRADALTGAVSEVQLDADELVVQEETAMTLLPIEEVDAYLSLSDLSDSELRAVPVRTILERLKDSNGDPISIPEDASVAFSGPRDYHDEYQILNGEATLNLLQYISIGERVNRENIANIVLIIGSGMQLNADNIQYNVSIYFSDVIDESIEYYFRTSEKQDDESYEDKFFEGENVSFEPFILDGIDIPITSVQILTEYYEQGREYYFGLSSRVASEHLGIQVDVYPMKNFVDFYQNGALLEGEITDQIIMPEHSYEEPKKGGVPGTYTEYDGLADLADIDNLFCIVYKDKNTGRLIGYHGILVTVVSPYVEKASGMILAYEDNQMKDVTEEREVIWSHSNWASFELNLISETNGVEIKYSNSSTELVRYSVIKGYVFHDPDDQYYYVLNEKGPIKKVVTGEYTSIEEAEDAGAEDITAQVLPNDRNKMPYGYPLDTGWVGNTFSHTELDFTIFFENGEILSKAINVLFRPDVVQVSVPVPDFQVIGAEGYDDASVYMLDDDDLDSLFNYRYRDTYQVMLINDINVDLTKLRLKYHSDDNVRVFAGGEEQKSGISEQDFSNGAVYYTAFIGNQLRNYYVSVMKKENGAKLFVNGPEERSVFLDSYYGQYHDVLVANIGSEELTGLNVELLDPINIKLDEYWKIGGQNNNTLAAFNPQRTSDGDKLSNLAKVRILPDGEGDISGTLKVSAEGQDDVYIKLIGHAGKPKIITNALKEAVQYVPYSYVIATNNLFAWNKVDFQIMGGKLPDGLQLNSATGEIYGVPRESGKFPITIRASYTESSSPSSFVDLLLTVKEPSNENVFFASDEGYEIIQPIGTETAEGTYDYVITSISDQVFISAGEYHKFVDLWLNGEKLTDGEDYTKESGSTKLTVKSQTFRDKARRGSNTIAAEFRENDESKELKRTAQNFRLEIPQSGNNSGTSGGNTSSSGSSGGSGRRSSKNSSRDTVAAVDQTDINLYHDDSWVKDDIGWRCKKPDGSWITNTWFQLPYQGTVEWYYFNEQGYMATGLLEYNGLLYYLNPISDGTQGKMVTGWQMIDGNWYYFKEVSDGTKGAMMSDIWIGEYYLDPRGVWIEREQYE